MSCYVISKSSRFLQGRPPFHSITNFVRRVRVDSYTREARLKVALEIVLDGPIQSATQSLPVSHPPEATPKARKRQPFIEISSPTFLLTHQDCIHTCISHVRVIALLTRGAGGLWPVRGPESRVKSAFSDGNYSLVDYAKCRLDRFLLYRRFKQRLKKKQYSSVA